MAQTRGQDALPCGCSLTLLFLQLLACGVPANGRADFAVLAPSEPILAVLGKDAELPCHLSLNISAEDMELRWYRDQPSPAVHVHRAGRDVLDEQMARYQGRTTFLGARLAQGWAAVRIHNVTLADNGSFHCCFRDGAAFEEATLWLRVAAPVSEKAPSMAAVLPLALVVMGLASAGITCLFWKCRRKKNRNWLDEGEGLGGADKQGRQASRNGDPTFQGWGEDDVIDGEGPSGGSEPLLPRPPPAHPCPAPQRQGQPEAQT